MSRLPIPLSALDDRLGIFGTAGSGKTYAAMLLEEAILSRGARVGHIDPLGVSWGLRLNADGKSSSPHKIVIFGGKHGDLPINDRAGALIGDAVTSMAESWIIDLSELGTKAAERRFMLPFLETLYRKHTGDPLHIVLDEADMWAPERLLDKEGEAAKLLGMMETLVRRGRVKGFIPWLISQRPAVLSKNVLSQVDGLIAMKLTSSQDRKALGAWIEGQADQEQGKKILADLPTKQRGEAVIWIPGRDILKEAAFPERETFDSSRTPKRGEKATKTVPLAPLDLTALREKLATVEEEIKSNDPRALRAKVAEQARTIADLEKRTAKPGKGSAATDREVEQRLAASRRAYEDMMRGIARQLSSAGAQLRKEVAKAEPLFAQLRAAHERADGLLSEMTELLTTKALQAPLPPESKPLTTTSAAHRPTTPPAIVGDGTFNGPQTKVLRSLAMWRAIGHEKPSREMVAAVAGYSPTSGGYGNLLGGLKTIGAIDYPSQGFVTLVANGVDVLSRDEGRAMFLSALTNPQKKIIEAVRDGQVRTKEEIAVATDYSATSGGYGNLLGSLRTIGVIDYPQAGSIQISEWAKELL